MGAVPHNIFISFKGLTSAKMEKPIIKIRKVTILTAVKDPRFILLWNKDFILSNCLGGASVELTVLAEQNFPNLSI